jgi:hypothetical protein
MNSKEVLKWLLTKKISSQRGPAFHTPEEMLENGCLSFIQPYLVRDHRLNNQQLVHILGPTAGGRLLLPLSSWPTEKVDISFFTPP